MFSEAANDNTFNEFEKVYERLEMGRQEQASSESNVGFLSNGSTRAGLSCVGKTPKFQGEIA